MKCLKISNVLTCDVMMTSFVSYNRVFVEPIVERILQKYMEKDGNISRVILPRQE